GDANQPVDAASERRLERAAAVAGAGVHSAARLSGADHGLRVELPAVPERAATGRVGDHVDLRGHQAVRGGPVAVDVALAGAAPAADLDRTDGIPEPPLSGARTPDLPLRGR